MLLSLGRMIAICATGAIALTPMTAQGAEYGEYWAKKAYQKALEVARNSRIEDLEFWVIGMLIGDAAKHGNQKEAVRLLEIKDKILTKEARETKKTGKKNKDWDELEPWEGYEGAGTPSAYIGLALEAVRIDRRLARKFFKKAIAFNWRKSSVDEYLLLKAKIGLLILSDKKKEALKRANKYCKRVENDVFHDVGSMAPRELADFLASLDPETGLKFTSRYDDFLYGSILREVAGRLYQNDRKRSLAYYRRAIRHMEKPVWKGRRTRILENIARAIGKENVDEALSLVDRRVFDGEELDAVSWCVKRIALENIQRAIELASNDRDAKSKKRLIRDLAYRIAVNDPQSLLRMYELVDREDLSGVLLWAAKSFQSRGDLETALHVTAMIPDVRERADALSVVARAIAKTDREKALLLLDEAFSMAFEAPAEEHYEGELAVNIAVRTAEVEPRLGMACFRKILEVKVSEAEKTGHWWDVQGVVQRLAEVDTDWTVPFLTTAEADYVLDILAKTPKDKRRNRIASQIAVRLGPSNEKDAIRFLRLIPEPAYQGFTMVLIETAKLRKHIQDNPEGFGDNLKHVEDGLRRDREFFEKIIWGLTFYDAGYALEVVKGFKDKELKDSGFFIVLYKLRENPPEAAKVIEMMESPMKKIKGWLALEGYAQTFLRRVK